MIGLRTAFALLLAAGGLVACGWVEHICSDGEVTIIFAEGGADCRTRTADDPECRDGEILRETHALGKPEGTPGDVVRLDCIQDEVGHEGDEGRPPL